ncbi:hypothetical protein [Gimesia sp.]|uniref:hypothetical protein n=1 Tax=Gimesia sp. TaxID=2024833 RepID=UPI000C6B7E4B|nr:hypothetical protein [Gimesia sp.]MAX35684.1 hypothetical protein [Gimesia sp.]HBL47633.1 hypothetical protein [Planctomycetaceae bacterium]|tara:strand:+ start:29185 stop:29622 length:438 start_codon:yes stop_codon:yes gene_type:complete
MKLIDLDSSFSQNHNLIPGSRKGAVIIIPLVCLILALAVVGELLKQTSLEINQLKKSQFHLQATWLGEAAVQRTVRRLKENMDYSGEVWQISSEEMGGVYPGEVIIEIERNSEQNQSTILVRTKASYPADESKRVRVIHEWPVQL